MASSKHKKSTVNEDEEASVDMSPMIDMVFLLLIFFIVNATAIIVATDPLVTPPIADNSITQENGRGRIVVNVREDGTFTDEKFVELVDSSAITEHVTEKKREFELEGIKTPKLHLRGDQGAVFKHARTAIKAAAEADVSEVVFAVYNKA